MVSVTQQLFEGNGHQTVIMFGTTGDAPEKLMTGVSAWYIIRYDYHKLISVQRDIMTNDSAAPISKEETSDINPFSTRWANGPRETNIDPLE
jgi:hypothetical protein